MTGRFAVLGARSYDANSQLEPPAAIVTIPHANLDEQHDHTLVPLLNDIHTSAELVEPINALIWGNTTLSGTADEDEVYALNYFESLEIAHLVREEVTSDGQLLRVTAMSDVLRPISVRPTGRFHTIRSNYMDWVIVDALRQKLSLETPIIWIDSDTPYLSHETIPNLIKALRDQEAYFPHANLVVCSQRGMTIPTADAPIPEKVTALYGMVRGMIEGNLQPCEPRGYVEESGMAMTLRTYLTLGGVHLPFDERHSFVMGESSGLLRAARYMLDKSIPLVSYVPGTNMGFSDRRFRRLAETVKPVMIPKSEDGEGYTDFTALNVSSQINVDTGTTAHRPATTTRADLWEMVRFMEHRQVSRPNTTTKQVLSTAQLKEVGELIVRWGFTD
jgi:hypothetical protein